MGEGAKDPPDAMMTTGATGAGDAVIVTESDQQDFAIHDDTGYLYIIIWFIVYAFPWCALLLVQNGCRLMRSYCSFVYILLEYPIRFFVYLDNFVVTFQGFIYM